MVSRRQIQYAANPEPERNRVRVSKTVTAEKQRADCMTYWALHGARIRASRRHKYATDPHYRERILASNRRSAHKRKA